MSTTQVVFHYVFMGWFAWATFSRISTIDKGFHPAIRVSMSALGICAFAALFVPTYLRISGQSWESMTDIVLWIYTGILASGAVAQTAIAAFWIIKPSQKVYSHQNVTAIVLEDAIRRRRA
jgi:hypothetical protein